MEEIYGLVIYDKSSNKHSISGDSFVQISTNKYQMLRSTHCSFYWIAGSEYIIYFIKYTTTAKDYHCLAHQSLQNDWWQSHITAEFHLNYDTTRIKNKNLIITSADEKWMLQLNYENTILSLPYIFQSNK
jgi:hypothetical protein